MKFLLRDIFVITLFIAIVAMYLSTGIRLRNLALRLASQHEENAATRTMNSKLMSERDILQADIDCSIQIEDLAKQIEAHFPTFQAKYSYVEPRGNKTISVRQIPMMIDRQTGLDTTRIRVHIPTERSVFLKFGVASRKPSGTASEEETQPPVETKWEHHLHFSKDQFAFRETLELVTNASRPTSWESINEYSVVGPFERGLPSGLMDVDWSNRLNKKGLWEMQLSLNEETLLTTVLELQEDCNSYNSLSAKEQLDFAVDARLPDLFTSVRIASPSRLPSPPQFQIHVWLDDQSSGFGAFPGADLK